MCEHWIFRNNNNGKDNDNDNNNDDDDNENNNNDNNNYETISEIASFFTHWCFFGKILIHAQDP